MQPGVSLREVVAERHGGARERAHHHDAVPEEVRRQHAGAEHDDGRVGRQLARLERARQRVDRAHRLRDEAVEPPHQQARRHRDHDAGGGRPPPRGRQPAVGERVEHDGDQHARDPRGEHRDVSLGARDVGGDDPEHEREADADGEGHGQAGDVDGGDQQDVRQVEDDAPDEGRPEPGRLRLPQVRQEPSAAAPGAPDGEREQQRQQQDADRVVPVEQLEAPLAGCELLRVRPRSPAQHRDDAHQDGKPVGLDDQHEGLRVIARPAGAPASGPR